MISEDQFVEQVGQWSGHAKSLARAEAAYARAHGNALAKAEGSNAAVREAKALESVEKEREARDDARIVEQAARWAIQ